MTLCDLTQKNCLPCEGGVPAMTETEAQAMMENLDLGWRLENNALVRRLTFKGFAKPLMHANARRVHRRPRGASPRYRLWLGLLHGDVHDPCDRRAFGERFHLRRQVRRRLVLRPPWRVGALGL
jgi:hypothetical protein